MAKNKKSKSLNSILKIVGGIIMFTAISVYSFEAVVKIRRDENFSIWSRFRGKTLTPNNINDSDILEDNEEDRGWKANLIIDNDNEKTFSGGTKGKWDMKMEIWTCDKDYKNAKWSGKWDWDWKVNFEENGSGFVSADKTSDEISFESKNGQANFPLGITVATANISQKDVTVSFFMDNLGEEIVLKGSLTKDYEDCNTRENLPE